MDQFLKQELKDQIHKCDDETPYIFISYCSNDWMVVWQDVVELQHRGVNIWIDKEMGMGESWWDQAAQAIRWKNCSGILFYVSKDSMTSSNVKKELDFAASDEVEKRHQRKKIPILPIDIQNMGNIMDWLDDFAKTCHRADEAILNTAEDIAEDHLKQNTIIREIGYRDHDNHYFDGLIKQIAGKAGQVISTNIEKKEINSETDVSEIVLMPELMSNLASSIVRTVPPVAEVTEQIAKPQKGKVFTTTGDITYTLYGQNYTDNQSGLMLNVFEKVIKQHPQVIPTIQQTMHCVSSVDYTDPQNMADMPSYYRACRTFSIDGQQVCVGTAYSMKDKLIQIAHLFQICGENPDVLSMDELELPKKVSSFHSTGGSAGSIVDFTLFDVKRTSNQSAFMLTVFEEVMKRAPESAKWALDNLTCASFLDYSNEKNRTESMPSYFRACKTFLINGSQICIGTSYSLQDKLKMIARLLKNAGFTNDVLLIKGYVLPTAK